MNFAMRILIAISIFCAASTPLAAQEPSIKLTGDVKLVKVEKVEGGEDKITLVEPATIVPGDRLVFGTDFTNSGSEEVTDFAVTNAVPEAVRLAPDADPQLSVSVDGGKTYDVLSALSVKAEDGSSRPAKHEDVTHVQWVLATVQPGESGRLEYPAIIR